MIYFTSNPLSKSKILGFGPLIVKPWAFDTQKGTINKTTRRRGYSRLPTHTSPTLFFGFEIHTPILRENKSQGFRIPWLPTLISKM